MKKKIVFFCHFRFVLLFSQEADSIKTKELKEVLVVGTKAALHENKTKHSFFR